MTAPTNLLFILSDEHRPDAMGHANGPVAVQTPNLDRLAREGTRFTQAYTPSPICVPARASLATGRYVHETGCWDSAQPYRGHMSGWGHQLQAEGMDVVSIGKLHYRSIEDDNGFSEELIPMHVVGGVGWLLGLMRKPLAPYEGAPAELAEQVGSGESPYVAYDRDVLKLALDWLDRQSKRSQKPWVLFVSFVSPHFPLIAPVEFYDRHDAVAAGWPHLNGEQPDHLALSQVYDFYDYARHFDDDSITKARRGYFGLTSFLDHNIGQLLDRLDENGLADRTRVMYSSDHGEMLGDHGIWTKMVMYEQSAGVPMILRGPDVPANRVVDTPVSLVDCHQTILECVGSGSEGDDSRRGVSLFDVANGVVPDRNIISEFHDGGSPCGYTMIRVRQWKYVYYVGHEPQLFNLTEDPDENFDRSRDPTCRAILAECESRLRDMLDPEEVDKRAFADQARVLEKLGGRDAVMQREEFDFGFTPVRAIVDT